MVVFGGQKVIPFVVSYFYDLNLLYGFDSKGERMDFELKMLNPVRKRIGCRVGSVTQWK